MIQRILAAAGFALLSWLPISAHAQSSPVVLSGGCGSATYSHNPPYFTIDTTGKLCVNASVSASITGFPGSTQTTGTPISVTTGGVTGTLPAGTVVVASNVGATNGAYCKLGASASTSDQLIPPNSWFGFTVGSNTQLTCITSTSTTTVNMVGGAGLPTGSGGGGGGSGGGAVTVANGADTAEGSTTDAVAATPASGTAASVVALLKAVNNNVAAAIPAGTNLIGSVTADPCATKVKLNAAIATSSGNVQLVAPSGSTKVYICSLFVVGATAFVGNIIEGTGGACTTANEAAVIGSTTAASGVSLGANGGWTLGNGGGTVGVTATAANGICLLQSGTAALAGNMTYVQQ